jgi:hypothetical protein
MTTIGRAPDNAIVINNPHTSQYHCTIERIDGDAPSSGSTANIFFTTIQEMDHG